MSSLRKVSKGSAELASWS